MEIVNDLCRHLKTDPQPKHLELTILPLEDDNTISFVKEGIYLGIHFPNLPYLSRIFRTIYQSIKAQVVVATDDQELYDQLMNVLTCLLLICPDHATAWCDRRRLILKKMAAKIHRIETCSRKMNVRKRVIVEKELVYLDLLYTQHSKAPNAWAYRKWVNKLIYPLFESVENVNGGSSIVKDNRTVSIDAWMNEELNMTNFIAEKYPKNYYCWTHRLDVIKIYFRYHHHHPDREKYFSDVVKAQIKWLTNTWLRRHVSDHSAAHYGGEIIRLYLDSFLGGGFNECGMSLCMTFLSNILWRDTEFSCQSYVDRFPSNEVVWIWRRICSRLLLQLISNGIQKVVLTNDCSILLDEFLEKELTIISNRLHSSFYVEDQAILFAKKYIVWNLYHIRKYGLIIHEIDSNISHRIKVAALLDDDIYHHLMNS